MRRCLLLLAIILAFACFIPSAMAHDDQKEHDRDLLYAIFGEREKVLTGNEKIAFQALADAAAITIDQFSPNDTLQWKKGTFDQLQEELDRLGVSMVQIPFQEIDLNIHVWDDTKNAEAKNITANNHRRFTHQGWNYRKYPNGDFWKKRKNVLLHTANQIFFVPKSIVSGIPWLTNVIYNPSEQCDAFCAVVYYIHILGDHIEGNTPDKLTDLEPLIQYTNLSTPGIITEIMEQLRILLPAQTSSWTFSALMQELTDLRIRCERNCGTWGAVDTEDRCRINQKYAHEMLDIISNYLPKLLIKETFFNSQFKE